MPNDLYFGEIAALISGKIHTNPDHILRINRTINQNHKGNSVYMVCAEAAKIFDDVEILSKDQYTNTAIASEHYADEILDFLLSGRIPNHIDMIILSARSLQNAL